MYSYFIELLQNLNWTFHKYFIMSYHIKEFRNKTPTLNYAAHLCRDLRMFEIQNLEDN